jgi:hypothetical protein
MTKPILIALAVACLSLSAGMCEQEEEVVASICKDRVQAVCEQYPECQWKSEDDGAPACKPRD